MSKTEERKAVKKVCYECGEILMGGRLGIDIHYVTNAGKTRWYCGKCMKKLMRGE